MWPHTPVGTLQDQDCNPKEDNRVLEASNSTMEDMVRVRVGLALGLGWLDA